MNSTLWEKEGKKGLSSVSSITIFLAGLIASIFGVMVGGLEPALWVFIIGAIIMVVLILLRQDELVATLIAAVSLFYDWYLRQGFIATQIMTLILLVFFFLARSSSHPWTKPQALWLWLLFIIFALLPALRGISFTDGMYYYSNVIFSSFIIYWLGIIIGRNIKSVRLLFNFLALFGTLVAIHAIIQVTTGVFLFKTTLYDPYLEYVASNYQLVNSVYRAGTFLVNPDSAGGYFATMIFIPLGLFTQSKYLLEKILYFVEMFLILLALLFTFSTGGWIPAVLALAIFTIFIGRAFYQILLPTLFLIIAVILSVWFPLQVSLQIQHAFTPAEIGLRVAAWLTGVQVILTFPLLGIGLGRYDYIIRAYPYRVDPYHVLAIYNIPLYHPQNSFLELAALAGIPIALTFLILLLYALWQALRNWKLAGSGTRSLIAAGIAAVVALSINSLSNPGWTLPPLLVIGWLVLGSISSPLLKKSLSREEAQVASSFTENYLVSER